MLTNLLLVTTLTALIFLPAWALLAWTGAWRDWRLLQRVCLAVGIGVSVYPVFYYLVRWLVPGLHISAGFWWIWLLASALLVGIHLWRTRPTVGWPDGGALALGAITFLTFVSRAWVAVTHPYPAWTDSLHHAMATQLVASTGQLPWSLQPYVDVPLTMYHLGLYALGGTAVQLTGAPAEIALVWTAQFLNALCIFGVALVLDRYVSRTAAIAGALAAGLLAHQPAFYVNWGRFTQLASQTVLLIAWVMTVDVLQQAPRLLSRSSARSDRVRWLWQLLFAALTTAAVFELHFRAASLYLLLLGPSVLYLAWRAWRNRTMGAMLIATAGVGLLAILLVSPVLWEALDRYVGLQIAVARSSPLSAADMQKLTQDYYGFDPSTLPYLVAQPWLLIVTAVCAVIGVVRGNRITWLALIWALGMVLFGNAYLLGISILNVTNLGAVLIMLYLPISLVIGVGVEEILGLVPRAAAQPLRRWTLAGAVLLAIPFAWVRATNLEEFRFFVTPADRRAMDWINAHLPGDAAFVINSYFWLPNAPLGTDGGYWIPFYTRRATNTGVMLSNSAGNSHAQQVVTVSKLVQDLLADPRSVVPLHAAGFDYVYVGPRGNFAAPGLDVQKLLQTGNFEQIYQQDGVTILHLKPAAAALLP